MEIPFELEFKNMSPSEALTGLIRDRMRKLEKFHPHITGCRVIVEAPHRHHHQGKQYQVHVRLIVPGNILVSSRDTPNPSHEDPNVAVRDAFDAMRRQLEDYVRIKRGDIKSHSG